MERDPDVSLRIAGRDYPVQVGDVAEGALYNRVNTAYTEKYGMMTDVLLATMRPLLGYPAAEYLLDPVQVVHQKRVRVQRRAR